MITAMVLPQRPVVLALGPHVDDIELGCAGTLLRLIHDLGAEVHAAVFSDHYARPSHVSREKEARAAAELMGYSSLEVFHYKDTQFPADEVHIREELVRLRDKLSPSLIFAPNPTDLHQDHETLARAAQREFRYGQSLLHYEINQFGTTNAFVPTLFVSLDNSSTCTDARLLTETPTPTIADEKLWILAESMKSQRKKPILDPTFQRGLMRMRGLQAGPYVRAAEAFAGRLVFQ